LKGFASASALPDCSALQGRMYLAVQIPPGIDILVVL
jgi:hypothetical protein